MSGLLVTNVGQLATPEADAAQGALRGADQSRVRVLSDAYIYARDGVIQDIGTMSQLDSAPSGVLVLDAQGGTVIPGLVDPHTHACFGGWRTEEFVARLGGKTYKEILQSGGGILATMRATRALSEDELVRATLGHLDEMHRQGTTTAEVKSGYGLSFEDELKQLRAIRRASREQPVDVVATFLGAHAVPPEFRGHPSRYITLVVDELLPKVATERLASFVDVFCEPGAFSVEDSRRLLLAAKKLGLGLRIHADEIEYSGGVALAAELGAASADHLLAATSEGLDRLADAGDTVAILLPATALMLGLETAAAGRRLVDRGIPVALATDFNPGSSPTTSMFFVMALGSLMLGLTPEEVLVAATYNAACSLGFRDRGHLAPGCVADLVVIDCPTYEHIMYRPGVRFELSVVKNGIIRNGEHQ